MKRITREIFDEITLDVSLRRLGVVELEQRLEFSPLLVAGELQDNPSESHTRCCVCKWPDDLDRRFPTILEPSGDGSTGPTSGGLIR